MAELKNLWMNNLGENLQRLDEAWAGPIEILVAVNEEDALSSHRAKPRPTGPVGQYRDFLPRASQIKPARKHGNDFRVALEQRFPI